MLIEKGVALPAETRRRNTSPKIEEFKKSSKSTIENASKSEIKSLSSITTNPSQSPSPSPTENLTSLQVTTNMTVTVNQKENEKKIDDINAWKPAPAPTKNVFYGVPTHVGEDGCIYLQPEGETVKNNLLLIKNALKLKYENIENEPAKSYPSVGQACAAKFYLDNCWHRAVVTKVNPPNIQVTFVDYGNSENVKLENIHLDIVLSDIPRQCIECILHGVEPKTENGEWLTSTLDFIHNNIVERKCKVVVMDQPLPDKRIPIKLFCNDVDITKMIVEVGHAKLKNQIESQEEKQPHNPISKQNNEAAVTTKVKPVLPFETAILPVVGTLFPVVVTQVFSFDAICIQKLRIDNPETDHEEAINEEYDKFLLMMADLSQNAECFPQLENIDIGMACCGMYTYDDNWYRCIVTNKVNDDVLVTYVDYGNSEVIPIKRLRELPIKYFALPQQAIGCKLSGIKPVGGEWTDEIVSKMEMKVFPKDGNLIAKINKWDETPEISLFVENFEGVTVLAYQNLIDEGLIEIEEDI
ncbi:RING finger protein 17-like [Centruroides sculpturatus]|uniref:RING finger protein 17-like n=1 Tax=Centruroides sculpturatus TaxID=218467 RepID=UPI000C6CE2B8|nr:RING finger protein 17-like [Centruroides sculpturatus]